MGFASPQKPRLAMTGVGFATRPYQTCCTIKLFINYLDMIYRGGSMKNSFNLVIALLLIGSLLAGCVHPSVPTADPAVLLAQYDKALTFYNQIEIGMSYEAALALTDVQGVSGEMVATEAAAKDPTISVPPPPGYEWSFGEDTLSVRYFFLTNPASGPTGAKYFSCPPTDAAYRKDALSSKTLFEQVELGMTYDEVAALLGSSGRLIIANYMVRLDQPEMTTSAKGFPGLTVTTKAIDTRVYYWWVDPTDLGADSISITFIDGIVTSTTEF
jgi:hypothetical protein